MPRGLSHKKPDNVVRVVGVANAIRAAQQHLHENVRRPFSDERKALPGSSYKKRIETSKVAPPQHSRDRS
jgi:hypothetical protein